ncbi:MAG TPA: pseudouridine synthase [Devosia sp.]|nr:pseudouridine synthase [Devosia sp.]
MSDSPAPTMAGDRLAKVMARAGLCSRRDAEEWIRAGRVTVNGSKIVTPAYNVTEKDEIAVDGTPLRARAGTRVWLYHKPRGLVVTEKDPEGRPTIFETLAQQGLPRVVSVGRLDINTEGLLLLTNDGGLKRVLELPATGWLRKYRVRAHGAITQAQLDALKAGIEVEGVKYGPVDAKLEREQGANVWLELSLREGKNREVKNVLAALGLEVNRLIRVSYGPFQLGDIPVGAVEVVKARVLKDQLGKKLADQAEVDFASDMPEVAAADTPRPSRKPAGRPERAPREERSGAAPRRGRLGDRPERRAFGSGQDAPRRPRPGAPRILFDDGREPVAYEEKTYGGKPKRAEAGEARGFRGARPARGPRPEGGDRPARAPRAETGARPARAPRPDGDARPARGARPDGEKRPFRGPRPEGDARPPRGTGAPRRSGPPKGGFGGTDTERPAGGFRPARGGAGGKAFAGKSAPGKSFSGKPSGRPFSGKPGGAGPRPARGPRKPTPKA